MNIHPLPLPFQVINWIVSWNFGIESVCNFYRVQSFTHYFKYLLLSSKLKHNEIQCFVCAHEDFFISVKYLFPMGH